MADKTTTMEYRYNIELTYLDTANDTSTEIKNECVKSVIVDHNYDANCMPVMYITLKVDRALLDNMIVNCNINTMIVAVYKYDNLAEDSSDIECFRKKFTYFLPNNVNPYDALDYNDSNYSETYGDTYSQVTMGLLAIDHINSNKKHFQFVVNGNTNFDCVKYVTSHMDNMIIEPFTYSTEFNKLLMPPMDSVNKALEWLNDNRVFYNTPYRFYQDYSYTYITSSAGRAVENRDETYSTILISIKESVDDEANDVGLIDNKTAQTYEVPINYLNTQIFSNTIANKSRTAIQGVSSNGIQTASLVNTADYMSDKVSTVRLNNDNDNMMYNLEHDANSGEVMLFVNKTGLDSDLFTINKRITVKHIERYQDYDGVYLLFRKRDCYMREDDSFILLTNLTLKKLEAEESI